MFGDSNDEQVLKQVYATLKERRRTPPPGGFTYPFPKNDNVVTKLGKLPPGPCWLCGSEKHWNRECPNYVVYSEGVKQNAKFAATVEPTEEETMYQSTFTVLLNQALSNSSVDFNSLGATSFFEKASLKTNVSGYKTAELANGGGTYHKSEPQTSDTPSAQLNSNCLTFSDNPGQDTSNQDTRDTETHRPRIAQVVEIADEEEEASRAKPKAEFGILESTKEEAEEPELPSSASTGNWNSRARADRASGKNKMAELFWLNDGRMFPESDKPGEGSGGETDDEDKDWEREVFTSERRGETELSETRDP
ncbi:hypothetical protein B0H13DRAFT_2318447 [Mycena leptocephala]|nr:hypothetical protein B0H13DRAFT_2318447 [Mycena leptocephala]